jgi:hypothetical protein
VLVVDELERAPRRELAVGLVDDSSAPASARCEQRSTVSRGSTVPVGLFGLHTNTTTDGAADESRRASRVDREVGRASPVTISVLVIARSARAARRSARTSARAARSP